MSNIKSIKRYVSKNGGQSELLKLLKVKNPTDKQLSRIEVLHNNNKNRVKIHTANKKAAIYLIEHNGTIPSRKSDLVRSAKRLKKFEKELNKLAIETTAYNKKQPFSRSLAFDPKNYQQLKRDKKVLNEAKKGNYETVKKLLDVGKDETIHRASTRRQTSPTGHKDRVLLNTLTTRSGDFKDLFKGVDIEFVNELVRLNFTVNEFLDSDQPTGSRPFDTIALDLKSVLHRLSVSARNRVEKFLVSKGYKLDD